MMNASTVGRRVVAAAGVVSVLALTGACGADSGDDAGGRKQSATAGAASSASSASQQASGSPASAAGKGLNQKGLDRLALTAHDVPGYTVNTVTGKGSPVNPDDLTTYRAVTPAPCRPVFAAAQLGSLHDFTAHVSQDIVAASDDLGQHASVGLSSYTLADARTVMTELRAALPKCTTAEIRPSAAYPGAGLGYSGTQSRSVSGYGDETLAFDATQIINSGGPSIPITILVVRQDSTIATFLSLNPFQPPTIPQDIVDAQLKKLA
ncbi:hypothetical protein [Streptomyces sp. ALI-76-A]|uniref:hypothetical protein n=1 Tax=Streptomyces sp. ALI-76-A TaxID=3025736 RepID=UPI00256E9C61|nr:hypothetical protein [Streptomyces sp. ALI-76-A]MDL5199717.1 hypothetical protein [Streptomyces sp. ALI-76-A]